MGAEWVQSGAHFAPGVVGRPAAVRVEPDVVEQPNELPHVLAFRGDLDGHDNTRQSK